MTIERLQDLLLLSEIELARTKEQLAKANQALKELERLNAGGGSAYMSIQILNKLKAAL